MHMKRMLAVGLAVSLLGGFAWGGVARMGFYGSVALEPSGIELSPQIFLPGWKRAAATKDAASWTNAATLCFNLGETACAACRAAFERTATGGVSARWTVTANEAVRVEQLFIGLSKIPTSVLVGGSYVQDGVEIPFPAKGATSTFGRKNDTRRLELKDAEGRVCLSLAFDRPTRVFFQDGAKFGGRVELRMLAPERDLKPGETIELGVTLAESKPLQLVVSQPVTLRADKDWIPLSVSRGILPGSALDFTRVSGVDAPAGKFGRVVVRNGHFEFENASGIPRRFYGVNLCFDANYGQTLESADAFAAELARRGYNTVRIHHHDGRLVEGTGDSTVPNASRLRELDALAAACIRHGIYISTDLFVSRPVPWKDLGVDRPGCVNRDDFKMMVREDEAAYSNLCAFAKNWLTHVNAFTGRRWADEPGVAWISLVNENCPDNYRKNLDKEGLAKYAGLESRFYARMTKFLREEVGARQIFSDLNGWSSNKAWSSCREAFDYVDMHFYVDHPNFLGKGWQLPSRCENVIPFEGNVVKGARWAGLFRLPGKPFTLTEWNFAAPGIYRGVGGIATGAWAAREGWDGLWRFAWTHTQRGVRNPGGQAMTYFDMSGDPLSLAGERAAFCLFLRGDLSVGDQAALQVDEKSAVLRLDTRRTVGGFAKRGGFSVGILEAANTGDVPTTLWASSLEAAPLEGASRILLTHLTDVQNTGARFADSAMTVLLDWGGLPHLMRRGRAEVSLALRPGTFTVYVLNEDGSRREVVPSRYEKGRLSFVADTARNAQKASYLYEIVRTR